MKKYDVIVIGSGAGGLTVAYTAKGFGKSVLLVDRSKPGGECTWTGCIPSKTLIHIAKDIAVVKKYNPDYHVAIKKVFEQIRDTRMKVYLGETPDVIKNHGIDFLQGHASFCEKNKILINGEAYRGKRIIIATGSLPLIPSIEGIIDVNYLTNETIFEVEDLPSRMIILGGGAIGVELSMALNDLGIEIDLVEMADRILISEELEMSKALHKIMVNKGIRIHTHEKAISVAEANGIMTLTTQKGDAENRIVSEGLILAVGRKPNIDGLALDKAGVVFSNKGIKVNNYLQTSNKNIYAIGDVLSKYQFSHMAFTEAVRAVKNAFLPFKKRINYKHVPWCTYSSPELGRTGMTEDEARSKYGDKISVYRMAYDTIDRAKTDERTEGLVKLIIGSNGKLLGASILGERAGELISELQVVKSLGIKVSKLGGVIHPYPTYSEVLSKLGRKVMVDGLINNPLVKLFRKTTNQ